MSPARNPSIKSRTTAWKLRLGFRTAAPSFPHEDLDERLLEHVRGCLSSLGTTLRHLKERMAKFSRRI
jgi:hypothetical protein